MYKTDPRHIHDLADVHRFPLNDTDVIISGFPRSGTNWVQVMVANLWDHWTTTRNKSKRVPNLSGASRDDPEAANETFLDGYEGYSSCIKNPSPRLMKCHLPREHMPERWPAHGKVLYLWRNPKDVCISYYHLTNRAAESGHNSATQLTLDEYVDRFIRGEVPYGPYLDSVLGWLEFEHPNLMKVRYEDIRKDSASFLRSLAAFLGLPASDDQIADIASRTQFEAMRGSSDLQDQINAPDAFVGREAAFMRRGTVGGWREELTDAMSARIDREIGDRLSAYGLVQHS
jgi:hypothetical protein